MAAKKIIRTPLTAEHIAESKRLKHLFNATKHGLSQAEFGEKYEIGSQGAVWQYLNARAALNFKAATGFAAGLKCQIADFSPRLAGEIEGMAKHTTEAIDDDFADVPRIDTCAAAGDGCELCLEEEVGSLKFRRDFLRSIGVSESNATVITVRGASMEPTIADGAMLLVNRANREPHPGAIYVFHVRGNGLVVKRVVKKGEHWMARSDNDDRQAFPDFGFDEGATLIGRAVWMGAKL